MEHHEVKIPVVIFLSGEMVSEYLFSALEKSSLIFSRFLVFILKNQNCSDIKRLRFFSFIVLICNAIDSYFPCLEDF